MTSATISTQTTTFLEASGIRQLDRGMRNYSSLEQHLGQERIERWLPLWQSLLVRCPDADMALNNLERFFSNAEAIPLFEVVLHEHPDAIDTLISLFSTSQFLSDTLVTQPTAVSMLGLSLQRTPTLPELVTELQAEVDAAFEDSVVLRAVRQYRARHLLRIGINDIIRDRPLEELTADIADVAEAAVRVALQTAERHVQRRFGEPRTAAGEPGQVVILAFGKLGGHELNYSSDIDLMVIFDEEGQTTGKLAVTLEEYYSRVITEMLRLLSTSPSAYRVDFRLRPEGQRGPLVRSLASTLAYYDTLGRTWERQALIKVRPLAGSAELGERFLRTIEPFVYRKYLSMAEISEVKAIKRKIEQRAEKQGEEIRDVKTGYGGIRDVEFVIQFLQLLNGGELPGVRSHNTLHAITALLRANCLTPTEGEILERGYRFLRRTEHRLQLLGDLQTHHLPTRTEELRRLAMRLGYHDHTLTAEDRFQVDFQHATSFNRKVLNHLLHDAFPEPAQVETPESDLILLPEEDDKAVEILQRYGFRDTATALRNLQLLSEESVPFLPTRRCRHFLASIAPKLLAALADTPDPDLALTNLEKVTASLGAKGVLWELFSFNEPSLKLYVDLCSSSQFLSQILMSHPGMIDELLDTLVLDQPKSLRELQEELAELCRGADPDLIDRILHSFQNKELLRIGVQDILSKRPLRDTLAALSDLAQVILRYVVAQEETTLQKRWGVPQLSSSPVACRYVVLGLGKLGGREMNYQSDLDLVLLYEEDGQTLQPYGEGTDNVHYFSELAQRVIKALGRHGPLGRLYQADMRLRPTGKSGSLVVPLARFRRYYAEGTAQLWERQALTRARIVVGEGSLADEAQQAIHDAMLSATWSPDMVEEIVTMRKRLESSRVGDDLKRGSGGIVDVEFLVQLLVLKHGRAHPAICQPNIWDALAALQQNQLLDEATTTAIVRHYDFLRTLESRQRIVQNQALDSLPESGEDLVKLVRRMGYKQPKIDEAVAQFQHDLAQRRQEMRDVFLRVVEYERGSGEARS